MFNKKGEKIITPGRETGWLTTDNTESFHFTGDYEKDRIAFKSGRTQQWISYQQLTDEGQTYLIPGEKDDTAANPLKVPIRGYYVVVKPFFKETSDKYMTHEKLKELAQ